MTASRPASDPPVSRFKRAVPLAGVIAAQGTAAALSLFTGLWVVRLLAPAEYALYTIATSVLGAMVLLGDAGIVAGATALGGQCWRRPDELGAVMNTARELRGRRAWLVSLAALPVLAVLLQQRGAGGGEIVVWVAAVAFAFATGLGQLVWEIPVRLHEVLRVTQRVAILKAAGRAVLTVLFLGLSPVGVLALVATGAAQAWASWRIGKAGRAFVVTDAPPREDLHASVRGVVRRALPAAVFGVLTQLLGLLFLALMGSTLAVAQFGALSRIAVVLGVLVSVNQIVFAPRFARIENRAELPRAYARYLGVVLALCLPLNLAAWWMPDLLLQLVGSSYAGIVSELRLAVLAATLQAVGGSGFALGYARGWHMPPVAGIASLIAVQAGCVVWLDLGVLHGVLMMAVVLGLHQVVVNIGYCAYRMRSETVRKTPAGKI